MRRNNDLNKIPTYYTPEWPEWDEGSDAFSQDDSYLDRTGTIEQIDIIEEDNS